VGLEHGADDLAEAFIIIEGFDLLHFPKRVKGRVVQVVNFVDVWVRDDDVGQLLHVADPVGDPGEGKLVNTTVMRGGNEENTCLVGNSVRT